MSSEEDVYEPEYEPEVIQVGDSIKLEVLSVVRKFGCLLSTPRCGDNQRNFLTKCSSFAFSTPLGVHGVTSL